MIPIEDENPAYMTPWVTYGLIALNLLVFVFEIFLFSTGDFEAFIYQNGLIASEIMDGRMLHSLISSMFLHADLPHLLGNVLFLYIFGNNIEDVFGRKRYLAYYLACGVFASLLYVAFDPASTVPTIGASGAIAGVLAAYLCIYPKATVKGLFIVGFPLNVIYHLIKGFARFPAYILIGIWFIAQFIPSEGVAYAAHIGGFLSGLVLTRYISFDLDYARKRREIKEKICLERLEGCKREDLRS